MSVKKQKKKIEGIESEKKNEIEIEKSEIDYVGL